MFSRFGFVALFHLIVERLVLVAATGGGLFCSCSVFETVTGYEHGQ